MLSFSEPKPVSRFVEICGLSSHDQKGFTREALCVLQQEKYGRQVVMVISTPFLATYYSAEINH